MTQHVLKQPYVVFLGDVNDPGYAKTGFGLVQWRSEACEAQLRFEGWKQRSGRRARQAS